MKVNKGFPRASLNLRRFYLNLASWEMKIGLKNCAQFPKLEKLQLSGGLKNQVLKKFGI